MIVSDRSRNPFRAFRGFGDDASGTGTGNPYATAILGLTTIAQDIATVVTGKGPTTGSAVPRPVGATDPTMIYMLGGVAAVGAVLLLSKKKR